MQLHAPVRCFELSFELYLNFFLVEIYYEIHFQNAVAIY
jgi:hypothetical protein